jgi:diketogulonate reductase-like aldo/keto reductase
MGKWQHTQERGRLKSADDTILQDGRKIAMTDNLIGDGMGFRLSRRTALKLILAAGFAARWEFAQAVQSDVILKRRIPATEETIPAVGLGTSDEFETDGGQSLEPLREVLRQFVALGGALIDTAPIYGNAESVIGNLIAELGIAKRLFVATKVRTYGKQAGIEQMETSEFLLNKRPLDLIQVHSLVDVSTQLDNLRRWKDAGRVRYIGITHSRVSAFDELERLMRNEKLDFVQLNYSFTEPDAEGRLLPLAADNGIAVLANRPFENGAMFRRVKGKPLPAWASEFDCKSWAQFSLKYILAHPAVTCVIPATSNPKHLVDNMGAGLGRLPDERMRRRMREYVASL